MPETAKTYEDYIQHAQHIDDLIAHTKLSSVLLATMLRLKDRTIRERRTGHDWFMQSEFGGVGADMLTDLGYVQAEFRKFEWHPSQQEGTFFYRLTDAGSKVAKECRDLLIREGIEIYY